MRLINGLKKEVVSTVSVFKYSDGSCQIVISGENGKIIGFTDEFPGHQTQDQLHLFLDTELTDRSIEDTNPLYAIDGGKDD